MSTGHRGSAVRSLALVSMPFLELHSPSIQLGILVGVAREQGWTARTVHANLDLAAALGPANYDALAQHRGPLVGEWLFSVEAFGARAPDPEARAAEDFAAGLPGLGEPSGRAALLRDIRTRQIPAYLDRLATDPTLLAADVVGFTCTFQQTVASIALARRLKTLRPEVVVVFGGASVEDPMGSQLRLATDVVDVVGSGPGERTLPAILDAVARGGAPPAAVSLHAVDDAALERSPVPDYDEYFARLDRLGLAEGDVTLPVESSRGCWWGEKHHCTFCGLNGATIAYRSKSATRVRDELAELSGRYGTRQFAAVDNILDPQHLRELPRLLNGTDYRLFYEIKANVGREELGRLAGMGVRHVQPGIESLSSRLLTLMRKGTRASQNVNLLRWTRYWGIWVEWNILCGFPGERQSDYDEQTRLAAHLRHLQPPSGAQRIWLERYSPLFTEQTTREQRRPHASYARIWPDSVDLDKLAYFFERDADDTLPDSGYAGLQHEVAAWAQSWADDDSRPGLWFDSDTAGGLHITDTRLPGRAPRTHHYAGWQAELYRLCSHRPRGLGALRRELPGEGGVERQLHEFAASGLVMSDEAHWLALAIPQRPRRAAARVDM